MTTRLPPRKTGQFMRIGPKRKLTELRAVRTLAQRQAVTRIAANSWFDYAKLNPCAPEVQDYQGPFDFPYVRKDGAHYVSHIDADGVVTSTRLVQAETRPKPAPWQGPPKAEQKQPTRNTAPWATLAPPRSQP